MFSGIFVPAVTPFDEYENVDLDKLKVFLDFLIKKGVHGIFLLGTNSEAPLLKYDEKKLVIKTAVDYLSGRIPVIAGVGSISTKETIELATYAEKVGADAIHVVTPYYYPVSKKGLIYHYSKVASSVEIPVIVYYIPSLTGVKIDIETAKSLAKIRNIIGFKDSSKDLAWFHRLLEELRKIGDKNYTILCGSDALILPYLTLGANGAVSAIANVFPEIVVELYEEYKMGHLKRAIEIQKKVLRIRSVMKSFPYMSAVKGGLKIRGLDMGPLRSPLVSLTRDELSELKRRLSSIIELEL